jgi:tetratricopeptide (TPR) repeat protein
MCEPAAIPTVGDKLTGASAARTAKIDPHRDVFTEISLLRLGQPPGLSLCPTHEWRFRNYEALQLAAGWSQTLASFESRLTGSQEDFERATTLHDESLTLFRELGDTSGIAISLLEMGIVGGGQGDYQRATALHDQSLTLFRELGDTQGIAISLNNLGIVAFLQADYERAATLCGESLTLKRELGDTQGIAHSLKSLGIVAFAQEDYERATTLCRESLVMARDLGDNQLAIECVEPLGNVASARQEPERAARLHGSAQAWREANGVPVPLVERQQHERMVAEARQQLDEATWTAAWEEGRAMNLEQAIAYALGEPIPQA